MEQLERFIMCLEDIRIPRCYRPNIREGDIVIMKEQSPHNQWPLGRVVEAILSEDGKVRKAKIAISRDGEKKVYYRPINELVPIMHA